MSDQTAEEEFIESMRSSGKMGQILDAAKMIRSEQADAPAAEADDTADAPEGSTPATVADTGETTDSADEEIPAVVGTTDELESTDEELTPEEEEALFLDLNEERERLLERFGGDIGKALDALGHAQSEVGRKGNELGELKEQITRLEQGLQMGAYEPYDWPDFEEDLDPLAAANQLHQVAEQAYARGDAESFQTALGYMGQIDPIRTQMYAQTKAAEIAASQQPAAPAAQDDLAERVEAFRQAHPDIATPEVQAAIGKEMEKFPTLAGILSGSNPNVTAAERVAALEEVYARVTSRQTADTVSRAARRVAIKTSEEARAARSDARVATADQRGNTTGDEEAPDTSIALKTSEGGRFNVSQLHREAAALADGAPDMVLRNGRMYVRQPDGSLVPRAD